MEKIFYEYKKHCLPCCFRVTESLKIIVTIIGVISLCVFVFLKCLTGIIISPVITVIVIAIVTVIIWWKNKNSRQYRLRELTVLLLEHTIDLSNNTQIDRLLDYVKEKKNSSTFLARFSTSLLVVFSIIISAVGIDRENLFDYRQLLLFILVSTIAIFILDFSLGIEGLSGLVNKAAYSQFYEDLNELLILDEVTIKKYRVNMLHNSNSKDTEYIVTIVDLNDKDIKR